MKINFADSRPSGDFALVLPVSGKNRSALGTLGDGRTQVEAALNRQRFEGEAGAQRSCSFRPMPEFGGCSSSATGEGAVSEESAEKLGGTLVSRLLISGETHAVVDLGEPRNAPPMLPARLALAASLRAWRYDRYRTTLKDKQKPTLEELTHRRRGRRSRSAVGSSAGSPFRRGQFDARARHRAGQHHLPETFVERAQSAMKGLGLEVEVLDGAAMRKLGMGALLGVAQGPSAIRAC